MHFYSFIVIMSKNVTNLKFRLEKTFKMWYDIIGVMSMQEKRAFLFYYSLLHNRGNKYKKSRFLLNLQIFVCIFECFRGFELKRGVYAEFAN